MEKPESRLAPSPEAASDDFASPIHPEPGEPSDRLAFEPVPLRYREDGFTPEKQRAYVEALADCGIAREAAARVGLSEQAINRVRRRSDARSFDRACEAAHLFGARRLRSIAYERAVEGTLKGRYYHGELISQERVYDNRLLIYLLGKTEPLLERDAADSRAICVNWEAHMEALEQGLPPPPAAPAGEEADEAAAVFEREEVWQDERGLWRTVFPPPAGFDGDEEGVWNGLDWYSRSLSSLEQAALDAILAEDDWGLPAQQHVFDTNRRDRFFGFPGGGIFTSGQAETYETSEPSDPDPRPMEYKSLVPPSPTRPPSFRRRPEPVNTVARDHDRGVHGFRIKSAMAPVAPGRSEAPNRPLRVSASPREPVRSRRFARPTSKRPPPGILTDEPTGDMT